MSSTNVATTINTKVNNSIREESPFTLKEFKKLAPSPTTLISNSPFTYLIDIKILYCGKCELNIEHTKEAVNRHLKKEHLKDFPSSTVKDRVIYQDTLDKIVQDLSTKEFRSISNLENIPSDTYYYSIIPINLSGYKCTECLLTSKARKVILEHLIKVHKIKGLTNKKSKNVLESVPILELIRGKYTINIIPKLPTRDRLQRASNVLDTINSSRIEDEDSISPVSRVLTNYSQRYLSEANIEREQDLAAVNIDKEATFFNRTTKYYKYLEGKDINTLVGLIRVLLSSERFEDLLFKTTREVGNKISRTIEDKPLAIRVSLNETYNTTTKLETKAFKTLDLASRGAYFKSIALLIVYLYRLYKQQSPYDRPILSLILQEHLASLDRVKDYLEEEQETVEHIKLLIEGIVLETVNSLLEDVLGYRPDENATFLNPAITFFIVQSIDARDKIINNSYIFREETILQNKLSTLIYCSRLFLLGYLDYFLRRGNLEDPTKIKELFRAQVEEKLSYRGENYFKEFLSVRSKIKYFTYNQVSKYKPITNLSEDLLKIGRTTISINKLRYMFNEELTRIENLFYKDILFFNLASKEDSILELDFDRINDLKDNRGPYNDLTSTPYLEKYKLALAKRYYIPTTKLSQFFNKGLSPKKNIKAYYKTINEFLEMLLLNIHLLSSSPLRGKELVLIRFRNTSISSLRNIFLDKATNLIAIDATSLTKSRDSSRVSQSNIRYLPARLTKIVVYYIAFVIPFIEYLNKEILEESFLDARLFIAPSSRRITATRLSTMLRELTLKHFKGALGIKEYRHLITYIIKERIVREQPKLLSPNKRTATSKPTKNRNIAYNVEDALAGHSTLIANLNYAREVNYFSNKTRDTTNRSIAFSKLYFNYFNILEEEKIESILEKQQSLIEKDPNTKRAKSLAKSRDASSIGTIDSSSLDLSNDSKEYSTKDVDIYVNNKSNNSSSSYREEPSTKPLSKKEGKQPVKRTLTRNKLRELDEAIVSPSKSTLISKYIDEISLQEEENIDIDIVNTKGLSSARDVSSSTTRNVISNRPLLEVLLPCSTREQIDLDTSPIKRILDSFKSISRVEDSIASNKNTTYKRLGRELEEFNLASTLNAPSIRSSNEDDLGHISLDYSIEIEEDKEVEDEDEEVEDEDEEVEDKDKEVEDEDVEDKEIADEEVENEEVEDEEIEDREIEEENIEDKGIENVNRDPRTRLERGLQTMLNVPSSNRSRSRSRVSSKRARSSSSSSSSSNKALSIEQGPSQSIAIDRVANKEDTKNRRGRPRKIKTGGRPRKERKK